MSAENYDPQIIRLPEAERLSGLKRATIYRRMAIHQFPQSVKLSDRAIGWYRHEVIAWNAARQRTRSGPRVA